MCFNTEKILRVDSSAKKLVKVGRNWTQDLSVKPDIVAYLTKAIVILNSSNQTSRRIGVKFFFSTFLINCFQLHRQINFLTLGTYFAELFFSRWEFVLAKV